MKKTIGALTILGLLALSNVNAMNLNSNIGEEPVTAKQMYVSIVKVENKYENQSKEVKQEAFLNLVGIWLKGFKD